jgi:hypothetical protein
MKLLRYFENIVKIYLYNIDKRLSFALNHYFFLRYLLSISLFSNDIIKLTEFIKFIQANYLNIIFK